MVEFAIADSNGTDGHQWDKLPGVQAVRTEDGVFSLQVHEPHETIPALLAELQRQHAKLVHLTHATGEAWKMCS